MHKEKSENIEHMLYVFFTTTITMKYEFIGHVINGGHLEFNFFNG